MRRRVFILLVAALGGLDLVSTASAGRADVVEKLEGLVTAASELPAEGGLAAVVIRVESAGSSRDVVLAPRHTLEEAGLPLATGDRVRVRVLKDELEGPDRVHRIENLTRNWSARLRTLKGVPMWNAEGAWRGGRAGPGPGVGPGVDPGASGGAGGTSAGRRGGRGGGGGGRR